MANKIMAAMAAIASNMGLPSVSDTCPRAMFGKPGLRPEKKKKRKAQKEARRRNRR